MEMAIAVRKRGDLHIVVWLHTAEDPSKARWTEACDRVGALVKTGPSARICSVIVTDGGAPNAAQRAQHVTQVERGRPVPSSVVTNAMSNPIKRGVATAISWVMPAIRFFNPDQAPEALAY